jgi:hypothetical protein
MAGYLGEFKVKIEDTNFKVFEPADWALYYIFHHGQIDGDHHKKWVLDQVVRILNGATIKVKEARWDDGNKEYGIEVGTSRDYKRWVKDFEGKDEDGNPEYEYDVGSPP